MIAASMSSWTDLRRHENSTFKIVFILNLGALQSGEGKDYFCFLRKYWLGNFQQTRTQIILFLQVLCCADGRVMWFEECVCFCVLSHCFRVLPWLVLSTLKVFLLNTGK